MILAGLLGCAGAPAADPPAPPVRFTSWNLKNYRHTTLTAGNTPDGTKPKPVKEVEAVTRILSTLQPDILGLCEVGTAEDVAALQTRLREAGIDLPHTHMVDGPDTSRHLALLSRYPIAATHSPTTLSYLLDESRHAVERGFLDVTLTISPDYALRLLGVHLKSRRDTPDGDQELMRRNEAHLLRQYADSILTSEPEANLLVYGDCNTTRDQPALRAIKGIRGDTGVLTELAAADGRGDRWTYYYPEADEYSRIDYLLASRGLLPEVRESEATLYAGADWQKASDHRPVSLLIHPEGRPRSRSRKSPAATLPAAEAESGDE